ncbi:PEP-CTERM sorting domain-containing protein [Adhaeretor mobilis]|uniref:PEP-CTERM protein-sorting domain-containing protein n=1 Tax=Adhaeretor mobilis TaxID=1930276 RepID=A0A517N1C6_9BACT|nr:PEP-CTERM sorting domain-containing protein [Adhaeretor mobilis]QDT00940.1 hypothetical protein HG15A2_42820 [Adhaeretor mobilis]
MKWINQFRKLEALHATSLLGVLYLSACGCGAASAATQQLNLNSTWSEHDPFQLGAGVQALSNQSSSGFTSAHSSAVSDLGEQPRVYQEFTGYDVSQVGQKFSASFDLQFHTVPVIGDTQFRFGFGDRTTNQALVPIMIDIGQTQGSSFRFRYDDSITDDENGAVPNYEPGNYSGFLSASTTYGGGGGNPTGDLNGGLGVDTSVTHTFTTTIERVERNVDFSFPPDGIADEVVNGWYTTVTWTSDAPGAETIFLDIDEAGRGASVFDVDTGLGVYQEDVFNNRGRIENIDTLGFVIFNNNPFMGNGSYTVSNFMVEYDDGALSADFDEDTDVDGDDLASWDTNYGLTGTATKMQGDADADMDVDGSDYLTWQQEFTGPAMNLASSGAVPEPSSLLLTLAAAISGGLMRWKRSKLK